MVSISYPQYSTISFTADTIAELRTFDIDYIVDDMLAFVGGQIDPLDGNGGVYQWNAASTEADDGFDIIALTGVDEGRWLRKIAGKKGEKGDSFGVRVTDFGAKGDGLTDDTAAIQAAADHIDTQGGGTLFFPKGTYMVKAVEANYLWLTISSNRKNYAAILLPSNITCMGEGAGTVIKLIDTLPSPGTTDGRGDYATTHMFVNKGAPGLPKTIVNSNIHIDRIYFDGQFTQQSGEGVSFCGVQGFSVTNCGFTRSYYETNYFVYCRGGLYEGNFCAQNGIFQIDGGGPMADSSSGIIFRNNVILDSGYYSVLLIDSHDTLCDGNVCYPDEYDYAAGFQAIRVSGCSLTTVSNNQIADSGFSAIWVHNGFGNTLDNNVIIHAGFAAGGGSNVHGITIDYTDEHPERGGRHIVMRNKVFTCNGAGIAVLEAVPYGNLSSPNAGCTINDNLCAWNGRDGITASGFNHRIEGNSLEGNGTNITTGVVGDGYSGISLNGAQRCIVSGNTATDIVQSATIPLNMDAQNSTTFNAQRFADHTAIQTQNYGIVEYPTDTREEIPTAVSRNGLTVTVTSPSHTVADGTVIHVYGTTTDDFLGYYVADVVDADTFTYTLIGNPVSITSWEPIWGVMSLLVDVAQTVGDLPSVVILNGALAGEYAGEVVETNRIVLWDVPDGTDTTGSTSANLVTQATTPAPTFKYAAATQVSDYNIITNNVVEGNLASVGYKAYSHSLSVNGTNSILANNIGAT